MGCPGGIMYAAFMNVGMTLELFEQITDALVRAGRITKRGHCFYPMEVK